MLDWQIAIGRILRLKILSKFEIWGSNFTFSCLWQEHTVIELKPDHFLGDLRLNNPWLELRRYRFSLPILMFFIDSFCSCLLFVCLLLLLVYIELDIYIYIYPLYVSILYPENTLRFIVESVCPFH